jgi:SAM-dependent methyltransferase
MRNSIALFLSQLIFSLITPLLLIPRVAKFSVIRRFVAFCFGTLYGDRYGDIIDVLKGTYGLPMDTALRKAKEIVGPDPALLVDCGTGTGFVTRQAAQLFPGTSIVGIDILPGMLRQAQAGCKALETQVLHVQADSFNLPLADRRVDLLLAQNTIACFDEFGRVLRPGGALIYVDTSARWVASLARWEVSRLGLFESVFVKKAGLGFYVLAQKGWNDPKNERTENR